MKLHQKIISIRKSKKLTIKDVHLKLIELFHDKALSYRTLLRIEKGETDGRATSLYQICLALGITFSELKKDIDEEDGILDFVKRNRREGRYQYNNNAYADILSPAKRKFLALELTLNPQGKTGIEKDPQAEPKHEKWVYVTKGKIFCIINDKKYTLDKGSSMTFDSSLAHSFENIARRQSQCIIVQIPPHI
ncbi:MAG: XRE family transcriptional regulator [Candidatus Omnitrophota bacterium]